MIDVKEFYAELKKNDIDFFAGVPDSLLKNICAYITYETAPERHIITANEGAAIALGAGYNIATDKIPLIYLQNSGLGNTVNPLLSLADKEVYAIPMFLMIGWRGEPGVKDEPQHIKQGRVTISLLDSMEIPYQILDANSDFESIVSELVKNAKENSTPVALLVRKNTFSDFKLNSNQTFNYELNREKAIEVIINTIPRNSVVVTTTGMTSRELFEIRKKYNQSHEKDFLTVGSMGHTTQIALGIALAKPNINVYCLDGDGSALMHLGSYAIVGSIAPKNLKVILLNNGAHDSVGGQPTIGRLINFTDFASSVNLHSVGSMLTVDDIKGGILKMEQSHKTSFMEVKICKGARKDLGRPTTTPTSNKDNLKSYIHNL